MKKNYPKCLLFFLTVLLSGSLYSQKTVNARLTQSDTLKLEEIRIHSLVNLAKKRKNPIAYSSVSQPEIIEKHGNQEFPEILKNSPSVYTSKVGGGFGDSRMTIRGFSQENFAVMINGIPVNDMQSNAVLWSNWTGLADVTSSIQVQRGLGASKLAITSVGGTMNIVTRSADMKEGGSVASFVGNNDFYKNQVSYATGKLDNGLSMSFLLGETTSGGYVDGTRARALNYFLGFGYELSARHSFQFVFTGAPQWHHNRNNALRLDQYITYGKGSPDIRYNREWGYLDGEEFNMNRNFYHKSIGSLNWDFKINSATKLSAVVYGSWGRGGGSAGWGRIRGLAFDNDQLRGADGLVDFEKIRAYNSGQAVTINGVEVQREQTDGFYQNSASSANDNTNGISRISGINSHNFYGSIVNLSHKFRENLVFDIGLDVRTHEGIHKRYLNDLFGADRFLDTKDVNNPVRYISNTSEPVPPLNPFANTTGSESIDRDNVGRVNWAGVFSQLEYTYDKFTLFLQAAASRQGFKRIDYFTYKSTDPLAETSFKNIWGGNAKAGINYNINHRHNVYFNSGYYSKQPIWYAVYPNGRSVVNTNLTNEKIFGLELGYGYRGRNGFVNVDLYRTSWKDRYTRSNDTGGSNPGGYYDFAGVHELHSGIEVEAMYRLSDKLQLKGMVSAGDWKYKDDVTSKRYDQSGNQIGVGNTLYLDGVKVGNAAQVTAMSGVSYEVLPRFFVDASANYFDNLYANMDPNKFTNPANKTLMELPAYWLADAGASYKWLLGKKKSQSLNFRFNCNNVFDKIFIAESRTNILPTDFISGSSGDTYASAGKLYKGVATGNQVFFGFGRTWNFNVRYEF